MANKTKLIQYSFIEKEDDGHNNKEYSVTKKAIFLDPNDNSGIGFLIIKSSFGGSPHVIYLVKEKGEAEIKSFCFRDNFVIVEFPTPGQSNSTPWNEIKVISYDSLLTDEQVEILILNFNVIKSYREVKKNIWEMFKDEL